ncbi:polysaccharide pyruvyl transferase family protein [Trinickia caryophylli]|uniref:Polysaccharide pyruvyl transferase family protein WcaK n=1 Tax=Trinickia caryophylli TaxID=28094 RepID=A0A1X7FTG2_TRICW|nr:polysaccharide pyruvyl transferase family protein [Trinickia caryophylli]PMS11913.1 polysaccharide pyruvyl transferase family protein [Trinickia caryophylli]TRX14011.1 polysaccharide pyruvyl transferase family protein [Trinickia caryophylli]WQE15608.1 polysaccharide pyruvyl transferase family protein [Trinickia caryophylli]SMF58504.1 Polysaccharide pyruvyl transferase family protein WcaK [Trinickia caryophylli]GLU33631.1 hypothetical protein Busp01_34730 [Trinickia caryophylli]
MTGEAANDATVLLGAFDRHNFGDLLFPHVVMRMLPRRRILLAGAATRDLRPFGGHRVTAFARLAAELGETRVDLLHVGGELLTCDSWETVVMLSSPEQLQANIASEREWRNDGLAWSRARLGYPTLAPYVVSRSSFPRLRLKHVSFNAVGGVDLDARAPALKAEVLAALKAADAVSVRDRRTQAMLEPAGISAPLRPDPAVMIEALFGARIARHASRGAVREVLEALPGGYAAVQFSADFGDDETLDALARQLDRVAESCRLGIAFFCAGTAPWHDDIACYERVAVRMRSPKAKIFIFGSLNIWDICALIARSRVYCGSSLHGRIVALAFALPRVNFSHPRQTIAATKQAAFASTWEDDETGTVVGIPDIHHAVSAALAADARTLAQTAKRLARCYQESFELPA